MDINFKGSWLISKYAASVMTKQRKLEPLRGKIINVSSIAGLDPMPNVGIYSCSKAAIIMLTKALAKELAPNITANAICPGYHITPIYNNDPDFIREWIKLRNIKIPLDQIGEAKQVADVALFLASPASDYITGQNIIIDGGMTLSINKL